MKKIVSVLSVAALTLSTVFAADISLSYRLGGKLYAEENKKDVDAQGKKTATQTRESFNLEEYGDSNKGDLAFTAKNDFAGFALTLNVNDAAFANDNVDTYYGWLNFSNVQVTSGKWSSRYVNRLDADAGNWEGSEFERYKPGVVGGKIAFDIDDLTKVRTSVQNKEIAASKYFKSSDSENRLSTAVAYTLHKDEDTALMVKGVLVDNEWGSTLRSDKDRAYDSATFAKANGGDIGFFSGFAGEVAYKTSAFDLNFVAKSLFRDELALGFFFRTVGESSSYLFGVSAGLDLTNSKVDGEKTRDHEYREFAFDFRARKNLTEDLTLTTMNNLSMIDKAKPKGQDYNEMDFHLWDMVSVAYKLNEKIKAQFTVESECDLIHTHANSDGKTELDGPFANGGFQISVIPGVVYSFNENATLTTGVIVDLFEIAASPKVQDDARIHNVSNIKVPVVFKVAL